MRYAEIKPLDVANGTGVRVSLWVQGCKKHCKGCFNPSTWDFNGGKEFTEADKDLLFFHLQSSYVKGLSILGGEPFEYAPELTKLLAEFYEKFPDKDVYVWSGYTWAEICMDPVKVGLLPFIDVLVDGAFEEDKKDITLKFKGSSNQRAIDVVASLNNGGKIVEWRWK